MRRDPLQAAREIEALFPQLAASGYEIKSKFDTQYNCIAFAAGDTTRWWWPDQYTLDYWPPPVPREATLSRFIEAFST